MSTNKDEMIEKEFFEYTDLYLEDHENFQKGFEDARTAFNEKYEDEEPFDIAEHAFFQGYYASSKHQEKLEQAVEKMKGVLKKIENLDDDTEAVGMAWDVLDEVELILGDGE